MAAQILDGKIISAQLEAELKLRVDAMAAQGNIPGLTVILVGDDPASQTYVANKEKACARLGVRSVTLRMPADTTQEALEAEIIKANADPAVHGILVQLPLPRHLDSDRALSLILPEKDVDGFHDINAGLCSHKNCSYAVSGSIVSVQVDGNAHFLLEFADELGSCGGLQQS